MGQAGLYREKQPVLRELVESGMGEHLLCDPAKVGYCPNDYAPGY